MISSRKVLRSAADWSHGILLENSIQRESEGNWFLWKLINLSKRRILG